MDPTATSAKCNQVLHRPGFPAFGPNLRDADNLSPPTPKESYRTRQSKNNSSRCLIFGNKGEIDSSSDSGGFGKEVVYSQESPKKDETFRDFDWEKNRFVEFRSPLYQKQKTLYHLVKVHSNITLDTQRKKKIIVILKRAS